MRRRNKAKIIIKTVNIAPSTWSVVKKHKITNAAEILYSEQRKRYPAPSRAGSELASRRGARKVCARASYPREETGEKETERGLKVLVSVIGCRCAATN